MLALESAVGFSISDVQFVVSHELELIRANEPSISDAAPGRNVIPPRLQSVCAVKCVRLVRVY